MVESQLDLALPFVVQRWVNGQWAQVARCTVNPYAQQIERALKLANPTEEYRTVELRWERHVEIAGAPR